MAKYISVVIVFLLVMGTAWFAAAQQEAPPPPPTREQQQAASGGAEPRTAVPRDSGVPATASAPAASSREPGSSSNPRGASSSPWETGSSFDRASRRGDSEPPQRRAVPRGGQGAERPQPTGGVGGRAVEAQDPAPRQAVPRGSRPRGDQPATGTAVPRTSAPQPPRVIVNRPYYSPYYSPYYGFGYPYGAYGLGFFYYDPFWWGSGYGYPYGAYGRQVYRGGYVQAAGALRLRVTPKQAEVFVDGYYVGIVDDFDGIFQRLHL
jgi:hypothetical protein